jgi:hypothetical protein
MRFVDAGWRCCEGPGAMTRAACGAQEPSRRQVSTVSAPPGRATWPRYALGASAGGESLEPRQELRPGSSEVAPYDGGRRPAGLEHSHDVRLVLDPSALAQEPSGSRGSAC